MMKASSVVIVACSAALLFMGASGPAPEGTSLAIAGLLGGGTLVPLAQFVGDRWVRTWPGPDEQVDRKLAHADEIPKCWYPGQSGVPRDWYLWTEDLQGVPISAGNPELADAHCQAVWGLSTRLVSSGHETTAIATNVQSGIRPFVRFTPWAAADQRLRSFLRQNFDTEEAAAVRSQTRDADTVLDHRPDCDPVYRLSCVVTGIDDDQLCFFEASRRLGTMPSAVDPTCDQASVVDGWYRASPDGFTLLEVRAVLTNCDGKEHRSSAPLVLINVGGRSFVVVKEHGYEDESFAVLEVRGDELKEALEIPGGGC